MFPLSTVIYLFSFCQRLVVFILKIPNSIYSVVSRCIHQLALTATLSSHLGFFRPGIIRTALSDMDREAREHFTVVIQAKDMAGQVGGLSGSTTINITLTDVNDNPPMFPQSEYVPAPEDGQHSAGFLRLFLKTFVLFCRTDRFSEQLLRLAKRYIDFGHSFYLKHG